MRNFSRHGSIDHTICSLSCKFWHQQHGWQPDVTLTDLRLGRRRFDIRFWRDGDKTQWEVLKGNHDAVARRSYASGSYLRADDDRISTPGS
jgi:hypothetical protein